MGKNFESREFEVTAWDLGLSAHDIYFDNIYAITIDWYWDGNTAVTKDDSHKVAAEIAEHVEESVDEVLHAVDVWTNTLIQEIQEGQHEEEVF